MAESVFPPARRQRPRKARRPGGRARLRVAATLAMLAPLPAPVAAVGDFVENVDLAADYRRIYGSEPGALVAIGITADRDDTDARIDAFIEGQTLH